MAPYASFPRLRAGFPRLRASSRFPIALVVLALLVTAATASAQTFHEYPLLTAGAGPTVITSGLDGNLWFSELNGNKIGRVTIAGVFTDFPVPTAGSGPNGIAMGPDGNLWFTEINAGQIGQITLTGTIT